MLEEVDEEDMSSNALMPAVGFDGDVQVPLGSASASNGSHRSTFVEKRKEKGEHTHTAF